MIVFVAKVLDFVSISACRNEINVKWLLNLQNQFIAFDVINNFIHRNATWKLEPIGNTRDVILVSSPIIPNEMWLRP